MLLCHLSSLGSLSFAPFYSHLISGCLSTFSPRSPPPPAHDNLAAGFASGYSGHDAAGERIHEGGGGKRDAGTEAAERLPW